MWYGITAAALRYFDNIFSCREYPLQHVGLTRWGLFSVPPVRATGAGLLALTPASQLCSLIMRRIFKADYVFFFVIGWYFSVHETRGYLPCIIRDGVWGDGIRYVAAV